MKQETKQWLILAVIVIVVAFGMAWLFPAEAGLIGDLIMLLAIIVAVVVATRKKSKRVG